MHQPDADAIIFEDRKLSHGEIFERVTRCAFWLTSNGVIPGEATGICIRNELTHLVCATALLCMGAPKYASPRTKPMTPSGYLPGRSVRPSLSSRSSEPWMAGLGRSSLIMTRSPGRGARWGANCFLPARIGWVAVYSNTSGTTTVPRTFEISYGRLNLIPIVTRLTRKRSVRFGSAPSNSMPIG